MSITFCIARNQTLVVNNSVNLRLLLRSRLFFVFYSETVSLIEDKKLTIFFSPLRPWAVYFLPLNFSEHNISQIRIFLKGQLIPEVFRVKFKSLFGYNPIVLCLIFWSELKTVHASLPTYRSIKKPTYLSRCFSWKLFGSLKVAFNILSNNWIIIVLKASYVTLDPYVMLLHRLHPTSGVVHIWHRIQEVCELFTKSFGWLTEIDTRLIPNQSDSSRICQSP